MNEIDCTEDISRHAPERVRRGGWSHTNLAELGLPAGETLLVLLISYRMYGVLYVLIVCMYVLFYSPAGFINWMLFIPCSVRSILRRICSLVCCPINQEADN